MEDLIGTMVDGARDGGQVQNGIDAAADPEDLTQILAIDETIIRDRLGRRHPVDANNSVARVQQALDGGEPGQPAPSGDSDSHITRQPPVPSSWGRRRW